MGAQNAVVALTDGRWFQLLNTIAVASAGRLTCPLDVKLRR